MGVIFFILILIGFIYSGVVFYMLGKMFYIDLWKLGVFVIGVYILVFVIYFMIV